MFMVIFHLFFSICFQSSILLTLMSIVLIEKKKVETKEKYNQMTKGKQNTFI